VAATVSGLDSGSEFRIDGRDSMDPADEQAVLAPEIGEDFDEGGQECGRVGLLLHQLAHAIHATRNRELIEEGLQQARLRAEEVVNGLPRDSAFTGECIEAEIEKTVGFQSRSRCGENLHPLTVGSLPPFAEGIGPFAGSGFLARHAEIVAQSINFT
jgi:hypothetical protein